MQHIRVSVPNGLSPTAVQHIMREIGGLLEHEEIEYHVVAHEVESIPLSPQERNVVALGLACIPVIVAFLESIGLEPQFSDEQLLDLERMRDLLAC